MFWKWIEWQIEASCDKGWINAETEYYINVKAGLAIPSQKKQLECCFEQDI